MGVCFPFLGGDCDTKTTTDITDISSTNTDINNSIRNVINQNCNQTTLQDNIINIIGSNVSKLTAIQKNSLQGTCIMQSILKSSTDTTVVDKLLEAIKNKV